VSIVVYDNSGITVIVDAGTQGPKGDPGTSTPINYAVDYLNLTALNIAEKKATLSAAPTSPEKTILDVITGVAQKYGLDFIVSGNQLMWEFLGLDGKLAENEQLRIEYFI